MENIKKWEDLTPLEQIKQKQKLALDECYNLNALFVLETNNPKVIAAYQRLTERISIHGQPQHQSHSSYKDFIKYG